ncbi:MAG: glucosaminidase domain-containing protein [Deltaproteobacteria bacterium]|nr:glucosaminidase domain-containing protein [Deltaproteobacteria bacterium]
MTGQGEGFYRDLFDDQLAIELSKGKGLGLADMLVEQLKRAGLTQTGKAAPIGEMPDAGDAVKNRFVQELWPHAEAAGAELGVDPRTLIAHAALETGWGRHLPQGENGRPSHNLFGIKATAWNGASVEAGTVEYEGGVAQERMARFRAYDSPGESFRDYVALIRDNPRYAGAKGTGADTASFARALQAGGYATDPDYAAKLARVASVLKSTPAAPISGNLET